MGFWSAVFKNVCPRCREGEVFEGLLKMHEKCEHCGYQLQKGSGYFVMSWFINYILSGFIVMPVFLALILLHYSYTVFIGVPLLLLLLLQPWMIRFSRLLWIHMDFFVEQSKKDRGVP